MEGRVHGRTIWLLAVLAASGLLLALTQPSIPELRPAERTTIVKSYRGGTAQEWAHHSTKWHALYTAERKIAMKYKKTNEKAISELRDTLRP